MSDGKVFTNKTTDLLVKVGNDNLRKNVPFMLRGLVKPVLRICINMVSKWGDKVIPDKVDIYINSAVQKGYEKEWDEAAVDIGVALDALINIKTIDPEHERNMFVSIAQALVNGIEGWINNRGK